MNVNSLTLVNMASNNLDSYICFISLLIDRKKLSDAYRDVRKIQFLMFDLMKGSGFQGPEKSPIAGKIVN